MLTFLMYIPLMLADFLSGINLENPLANVFWGWAEALINDSIGHGQMQEISTYMYMGSDAFDNLWAVANSAFTVVKDFGFALISTFFILHLLDLASKDNMSVESITKALITLIIAVAIAGNLETVINTFLSIGDSIVENLYKVENINDPTGLKSGTDSNIGNTIITNLKSGAGVGKAFGAWFSALILKLISLITNIIIDLAVLSRMLDIAWRVAFTPIGIANIFEGGMNSKAMGYLKGLLASALSGAVMLVILAIGFALSASLWSGTIDGMGGCFWASGALLSTGTAAMAASSKVKEIIS